LLKYILSKLAYGLLVLWGVVTVVFFIFTLGGDPVENLVAENSTQEVKDAIRKKFNLDLPVGERYVHYLNDLSPISLHGNGEDSRNRLDTSQYSVLLSAQLGSNTLAIKAPFLSRSYISERSVTAIIGDALPGTAVLAIVAMIFAIILGLSIGVLSALNKDGLIDRVALVLSVLGMSGPSFFMAILVAWIGGYLWYETTTLTAWPIVFILLFVLAGLWRNKRVKKSLSEGLGKLGLIGAIMGLAFWILGGIFGGPLSEFVFRLPGTGLSMTGSLYDVDIWEGQVLNLKNLILPALTLGIRPLAVIVQLTRNSLLEVMQQDYIRTARAKGLKESAIIWRHALKNALNPVLTAISGWFASMLAGAVFVEFVFGWKGLGLETYSALEKDDLPVVMGAVVVIASIFVVINLLTDLMYGVIDPRVRIRK
jgi:peptide/nickel transport system permease protein